MRLARYGRARQTAHQLPHRVPGLAKLNMAGLEGITESGVAYISFLPALKQLCLARCNVREAIHAAYLAAVGKLYIPSTTLAIRTSRLYTKFHTLVCGTPKNAAVFFASTWDL